jgi:hypothetical protein
MQDYVANRPVDRIDELKALLSSYPPIWFSHSAHVRQFVRCVSPFVSDKSSSVELVRCRDNFQLEFDSICTQL